MARIRCDARLERTHEALAQDRGDGSVTNRAQVVVVGQERPQMTRIHHLKIAGIAAIHLARVQEW